jgi:hypothetical protein
MITKKNNNKKKLDWYEKEERSAKYRMYAQVGISILLGGLLIYQFFWVYLICDLIMKNNG